MRTKLFLSTLLTILLLSGCQSGGDTPDEPNAAPEKEASGWYMRTTVEANTAEGKVYTHKSAGVFGALEESNEEKDRHDIKAFGKAALYVVFPKTVWNDDNGDYFSDYRHYSKGSTERQVWTFQVKNETIKPDLSDAALKIALNGPYNVYKKSDTIGYDEEKDSTSSLVNSIHLVDVDNDQQYSYAELANLQLSMEGKKIRTFRWVLGDVQSEDYEDLTVQNTSSSLKLQSTESEREPESKFGFPPVP